MKIYKTRFGVPYKQNGKKGAKSIAVSCSDDDFFFYKVLAIGEHKNLVDVPTIRTAEIHFFYNGYNWIDNKIGVEPRVGE